MMATPIDGDDARLTEDGNQVMVEPSAAQRAAALALYQMYVALTQQGFTGGQALVLVGRLLVSVVDGDDDATDR